MPAVFVLIMSLTLKNTLVEGVALPRLGWTLETDSRAAHAWAVRRMEPMFISFDMLMTAMAKGRSWPR